MWEQQFKIKYNHYIEREKKAEIFFNNNFDKIEKRHIEEYHKIIKELSGLIQEYRKVAGKEMTTLQILEGFE